MHFNAAISFGKSIAFLLHYPNSSSTFKISSSSSTIIMSKREVDAPSNSDLEQAGSSSSTPIGPLAQCQYSYSVMPLLLLPHDSTTATVSKSMSTTATDIDIPLLLNKISVAMSLVQTFFSGELKLHGFSTSTDSSSCSDSSDCCVFHFSTPTIFQPGMTFAQMAQMDLPTLWSSLATQIHSNPELWSPNKKYVVFLIHPLLKTNNKNKGHHHGLGGGGLALLPLHGVISLWPTEEQKEEIHALLAGERRISDKDLELIEALENYGEIGGTRGWLYAASLGALAHEIAHTFHLGHTEKGLMGPEFHKSIREFFLADATAAPSQSLPPSSAALIYYSKWFSNNSHQDKSSKDKDKENELRLEECEIISDLEFGLGALEIRDEDSGLILKGKEFVLGRDSINTNCSPVKKLKLYKSDIPVQCLNGRAQLTVVDCKGNILIKLISRDSLPHCVTPLRK